MHPLPGGVGFIAQRNVAVNDDTSRVLNRVLNDAVSDTTGGDSSNVVHYIIITII
jgi:hypothetical protein